MATECPVLLLDEPTAALDPESVERIIKLIRNIAKQGRKTILLIEHNLDVVRGLVEEAYFMGEGRVLAYGEPGKPDGRSQARGGVLWNGLGQGGGERSTYAAYRKKP